MPNFFDEMSVQVHRLELERGPLHALILDSEIPDDMMRNPDPTQFNIVRKKIYKREDDPYSPEYNPSHINVANYVYIIGAGLLVGYFIMRKKK